MKTLIMSYKDSEVEISITKLYKMWPDVECYYLVRKNYVQEKLGLQRKVFTLQEAESRADGFMDSINYEN